MTQILQGKVAIVTGAAKGIGLAIAKKFSDAGAIVVLSDIDSESVQQAAAQLQNADALVCDVTDESQVEKLIADTVARHGHLDVMVSNAGIAGVSPLVQMSLEEWRSVLSVDLDGVFLCTKHAGRVMAQNGRGSIINIASIKAFGGSPRPVTTAPPKRASCH
jgi:NAD(P)-dependent dehydrogenase (short-subunit alcohol dehydrogenase family)